MCLSQIPNYLRSWELHIFSRFVQQACLAVLGSCAAFPSLLKTRAALQLENAALRHQIGVLQRGTNRPKLTVADRVFWVALSRIWGGWRSALAIVKPETVIAWHRKGFQLFWTWKIRRGKPGRPAVPREIRDLLRTMSRDNPLWGAPRIHGELLKLGIDVGETISQSRHIRRRSGPLSNCGKHFHGTARPAICCEIAIGSSGRSSFCR